MNERLNVLLELGLEELPTQAVLALSNAGAKLWAQVLDEAGLRYSEVETFATPRRLAWRLRDVAQAQEKQLIERKGPSLKAAKDAEGNWTKAALGFAASCGVTPEALTVQETKKGAWLMFHSEQAGQTLQALLPALFEQVMHDLPIAKRMRWGSHEHAFVRPVLSLLVLADNEVLPLSFFGVQSGRETLGHRVHHPEAVVISGALAYEQGLENAYVMAKHATRVATIRKQVAQKAADLGGYAVMPEALLEEVASLVEWPVAVAGGFDAHFLEVPQEVLITTMQDNQKSFAVVDDAGKMLPYFIAVANIESREPEVVSAGNEKVVRPRFADAAFFWEQDLQRQLCDYLPQLEKVVFQEKLGSMADKSARLTQLAAELAVVCGAEAAQAQAAAKLSKCDLLSEMVMEFPELQGTMGRYYAQHEGLEAEVAAALEEQYLPSQAGGKLPQTATGLTLALAEKFDVLVGGFAIGAKPTGSRDPYALRRMAIGCIRLIIEKGLSLSLTQYLQQSAATFPSALNASESVEAVRDYVVERLQGYYREQGIGVEVYQAVQAVVQDDLLDFDCRVQALKDFIEQPQAASLLASAKRIRNILRNKPRVAVAVAPDLLVDAAEQQLWRLWLEVEAELSGDYTVALQALVRLGEPLETFFAEVMVMAEDATLRDNRLALLQTLQDGFAQVADLSALPG